MSNFEVFDGIIDEMTMVYKHDNRPWLIGYSGGKDSSLLVSLVVETVLRLPESARTKQVFIVTSDTGVENPIVKNYMHFSSQRLNEFSQKLNANIHAQIIYPDISQSFWSLLIGLGYPTPEPPGFRWCTDRLKIMPMNAFVTDVIAKNGEAIILLGVRKGESELRKRNITKREIEGKLLTPHTDIKHAFVFNPLSDIPNDVVWKYLLKKNKTPWGMDTKFLYSLYHGKELTEEQSALGEIDDSKMASAGNSRFGCWCCTIVKQDKSLNAFIEQGKRELIPLKEFRDFLFAIRKDRKYRDNKRANGTFYTTSTGKEGLGPFTLEGRYKILEELLILQTRTNFELITIEELKYIQKKWELEGDLSRRLLPDLYYNVTGKRLPWDKFKIPVFDADVVSEIKDLCSKRDIPFELISKLIMGIEANKHLYKSDKLKKEFFKLLNQDWVHKNALTKGEQNEN